MKINVTSYQVLNKGNHDKRLTIGIDIKINDSNTIHTSAIIQLYPIWYFEDKVPTVGFSLLYFSSIVYAIDRAVDRTVYSIDGWSRMFEVEFILPEYQVFESHHEKIEKMLSFLTGDYWECHFIAENNPIRLARYRRSDCFDGISQVNLFSGGMDSLIGAIDFMASQQEGKVFLASHYDSHMSGPNKDQQKLLRCFHDKYSNRYKTIGAVMITPKEHADKTCRSRSLMFISIALIVAAYANCNVCIPENGSVSLNFPLSVSRRASCSTRTTHPVFLRQLQSILDCLELSPKIFNPYEKKTKGEMVRSCVDKHFLINHVSKSNSCGKRSMHQHMYDNRSATHCGHCMPCMYRKAALVGEIDRTSYGNMFITLYNKRGDKVSEDFFAMLDFLKKDLSREQIARELRVAGMSGFKDIEDYIDLVERTREELRNMLRADNNTTINQYMGWQR